VVPWQALVALIAPHYPSAGRRGAKVRARVEHPFRVVKRPFGHVEVRYRGLARNTAQLMTLFALSNLWMARGRLLAMTG
jgi:IS5 family transposase